MGCTLVLVYECGQAVYREEEGSAGRKVGIFENDQEVFEGKKIMILSRN